MPSYDCAEGIGGLHRRVDAIQTRGATDIEQALARGYEEVNRYRNGERQNRVLLLTDTHPNTNQTNNLNHPSNQY